MAYNNNPNIPRVRMDAVRMARSGRSTREVARHFGFSHSSIVRWMAKAPSGCRRTIPTLPCRPYHHPLELPDATVEAILAYRRKYRRCAEVIHYLLKKDGIDISLSSVKRTLKRNNMTYPSKWKKWHIYPERPIAEKPGILVEIDTVHIPISDSMIYVYTMLDTCSRYAHASAFLRRNTWQSLGFTKEAKNIFPFEIGTIQSDHGSEFSKYFTGGLRRAGINHRHSRVRKPTDNAHVERFNRTLKQECLNRIPRSLKSYQKEIPEFIKYYNTERPHMSLDMQTPDEVVRSY